MLQRIFKISVMSIITMSTLLILSSCNGLPKDVPLAFGLQSTEAPSYEGFDGITSAHTINEETILITWNTTVDTKVLYYNVYDSTIGYQPLKIKTVQATPGASQLTALLTKQTANQHYKYRVRAANAQNLEDGNTKDADAIPFGGVNGLTVLDGTSAIFKHFPIAINQNVKVFCAQKRSGDSGFDKFVPPTTTEGYNLEVSIGTSCTTFCGTPLSDSTTKVSGFTSGVKYACRVAVNDGNFTDDNALSGPTGLQPFIPVGDADHLTFTTNPPLSFTADNAEGFKVDVAVSDKSGNNIITAGKTGDDSILDVTLKDDLGTQLAKVKAVGGVANFEKITLTKAGSRYIIASANSSLGLVITGTSPFITVNAGEPSATNSTLVLDPPPPGPYSVSDGSDPSSLYNLKVTLVDKYNNPITSNTTVSFTTSDPQKQPTISPTPQSISNADGTVTFKYAMYSKYAGPMTFSINSIKNDPAYVPQSIVVNPGSPVGVKVSTPPYNGASIGSGNLGTVKVDVIDSFGNIVWNLPSSVNVSLNFNSIPTGSAGWLPGTVNTLPAPIPTATPGYKDINAGRAIFVADPTKSASLGVDKAGTYSMEASGFGLNTRHSVTFNVLTGGPVKLAFAPKLATGTVPTTGVSGACLGPIDIQVQDNNGNKRLPSSAITVSVNGSNSTNIKFFKNNLCNNPPAGITTPLTMATDTYSSLYVKDTGESSGYVTIQAVDSIYANTAGASGLQPATHTIAIKPYALALNNLPTTVVAGKCTPITLNTVGSVTSNANAAPTPVPIVTLNGLGTGSVYSANDPDCTGSILNSSQINLSAGTASLKVHYKDNAVMSLGIPTRNFTLVDNGGIMQAGSGMFTMVASNIGASPNGTIYVTAGACYGPFTVSLLDSQDPAVGVVAPSATNLKYVGTSSTGLFYTTNTCATPYNNTTNPAKIQTGQTSTAAVYFKDTHIERLNTLQFQDPLNVMIGSSTIDIIVTPASISLTGPSTAKTNECKPYVVKLLDAQGSPQIISSLLAPVTLNLLANDSSNPAIANTGGAFYATGDSSCTGGTISQLNFNMGDTGNRTVYFQPLYPRSFTLRAVDNASTNIIPDLPTASTSLTVNAAKGWLGNDIAPIVQNTDKTFNLSIAKGISPIQSRVHGFTNTVGMRFSANKQYLYVPDWSQHRVTRYDFNYPGNVGQPTYAGWIGAMLLNNSSAFTPVSGAGVGVQTSFNGNSIDFDQACTLGALAMYTNTSTATNFDGFPIGTRYGATGLTPGWCVGGQSGAATWWGYTGTYTSGMMQYPTSVVDDGTYIYVGQYDGAMIGRYVAATGQFAGWIGRVYSSTNMANANDGVSSGCPTATLGQPSPGWCIGGDNVKWGPGGTASPDHANYWLKGDGGIQRAYSLTTGTDNNGETYLYVGDIGRVGRFKASDGTWMGWIGWLNTAATGGGSAFDVGPSACSASSTTGQKTPGWCKGGQTVNAWANDGRMTEVWGIYADSAHNHLYVGTANTVYRYNLTTGAYIDRPYTGLIGSTNLTFDGTYLYIADYTRVVKIDPNNPSFIYWMGKMATSGSPSPECGNSNVDKTPSVWCNGGSTEATYEEDGFAQVRGIDFDGNGNLFTSDWKIPRIQKWNITGGSIALVGTFSQPSGSPKKWSTKPSLAQAGGYDDNSFLGSSGAYLHAASNSLFVADQYAGRIKKIDLMTGKTIGWIGGLSTTPTGGDANCLNIPGPLGMLFNSNVAGGAWCLGGSLFPFNIRINGVPSISFNNHDGILYDPYGIAGDGTYLYVTDLNMHRIVKFNMATGQFIGWVGRVNSGGLPTGGACATTTPTVGLSTPGWCTGGNSVNTDQNAANWEGLYRPAAITVIGGNIYVVDTYNQRVVSYVASTGEYRGWIGRVNNSYLPSQGCSYDWNANNSYKISKTGWCKGGRAQVASQSTNDVGGEFYFDDWYQGLTNDGTNLYIGNRTFAGTDYGRIDKFNASTGGYIHSYLTSINAVTPTVNFAITQNTDPATVPPYSMANKPYIMSNNGIGGRALPSSLWTDNNYLYVSAYGMFGNWVNIIIKIRLSDGFIMGWQAGTGSSLSARTFTGGEDACTKDSSGTTNVGYVQGKVADDGYVTPGWCIGGSSDVGLTMGGFSQSDRLNITGDSAYIYVTDRVNNRITRIPK